jgi:hypothetical protein
VWILVHVVRQRLDPQHIKGGSTSSVTYRWASSYLALAVATTLRHGVNKHKRYVFEVLPSKTMTPKTTHFRIKAADNALVIPAGLLVTAAGIVLLAWIGWLIWYDTTTWGKSPAQILLGSRIGEAMSLGIDAKAVHYMVVGGILLPIGLIVSMMQSVKNLRINEGDHEIHYAEASASSPSNLNAKITMTVVNHGVFPVTLRNMDVKLTIGGVKASSLFFKDEGFTVLPRSERDFFIGCRVMGEEADALYAATEYQTHLRLQGNASAIVYRTPFNHEAEGIRKMVHADK